MLTNQTNENSHRDPFCNLTEGCSPNMPVSWLAEPLIKTGARDMCERDPNWIFSIALTESASYFFDEIDNAIEGVGIVPIWSDARI